MCQGLIWLFLVTAAVSSWVTVSPSPSLALVEPCGGVIGDAIWYITSATVNAIYGYYFETDTWTTKSGPPTAHSENGCAVVGDGFLVGKTKYEKYIPSSDLWVSITDRPVQLRKTFSGSNEGVAYFIGQNGPTNHFHRYTAATDSWGSLRNLPAPRLYSNAAVVDGHVYVTGNDFWDYTIATDAWTCKTAVPQATNSLDALTATATKLFSVHLSSPYVLWTYDISLDSWTALDAVPGAGGLGSSLEAVVVDSQYVLVCAGQNRAVHKYETGIAASGGEAKVVGDPVFTTFSGKSHHLALHEGVFNIFTTPTMAVNIMVQVLPDFPPEDDHMIVMVGVTAMVNETLVLVTCGVEQDKRNCTCAGRYVFTPFSTSSALPAEEVWKPVSGGFLVTLPEFSVRIRSGHVSWVTEGGDDSDDVALGQHLDVHIVPAFSPVGDRQRFSLGGTSGILVDLELGGERYVQERMAAHMYEVVGGGLLALESSATAGTFLNASFLMDGAAL